MNRDIFTKIMRESGRKAKYMLKGGGPVNFEKKIVLRRDSVMLVACL